MRTVLILLLTLLLSVSPLFAYPDRDQRRDSNHRETYQIAGQFSPAERHTIRSYLAGDQRQAKGPGRELPPGLQKKAARGKPLPPGWQKKLAPGQSLEYRIYRQGTPLPSNLLNRLPPAPAGTEIIQVEDTILRLNAATRTILDIFLLVPSR